MARRVGDGNVGKKQVDFPFVLFSAIISKEEGAKRTVRSPLLRSPSPDSTEAAPPLPPSSSSTWNRRRRGARPLSICSDTEAAAHAGKTTHGGDVVRLVSDSGNQAGVHNIYIFRR